MCIRDRAKWVQWEPAGRHNAREGSRLAFGEYVEAQYAVDKADVILSLDADFLCLGAAGLRHARAFASRLGVAGAASADLPEAAKRWLDPLVKDLQGARGRSLVIAGDGQPPAVHALAHAMNLALGNAGATVTFTQTAEAQPIDQRASLRELVGEMNAGTVEFLVILSANPVFSAPVDLQFDKALE